ncbi:MAG: CDP-alcohol phosphatidyltransferase family protein [Ignavibacterium sp.]|nr:MAG: CDP-alcohol phosphatidyltransferase family protein [Ignavibacterium sp.]
MYSKKEIYTSSNLLSFLRLLMAIPFWILLGSLNEPGIRYIVAALAIIAAVTDLLDGYLARKYNQVTELGKIIDPLADKVVIGAIVIRLFLIGEISDYYFYMIIVRDILIFLGGIYVTKKIGRVLPSNMLGKISVAVISIVVLLIFFDVSRHTFLFEAFYYGSIVLIFVSLFAYIYRALEYIKKESNETV